MVGARGFEPPTSRSRTERSTRLSHAPRVAFKCSELSGGRLPFLHLQRGFGSL